MAIFYTDSGSFNDLKITGSVLVSGSLVVTGSAYLRGLGTTTQTSIVTIDTSTGQLYTTASSALSVTIPASSFIATGSVTASVDIGSTIFQIVSASATKTSLSNLGVQSWLLNDTSNIPAGVFSISTPQSNPGIIIGTSGSTSVTTLNRFNLANAKTYTYMGFGEGAMYGTFALFSSSANINIGYNTLNQPNDTGYKLMISSSGISGSFNANNILFVSGSNVSISGSLTVVTGSGIEFQVLNTGVKIGNIITDTHTVTGSLNISGSLNATSSWATNALTASKVSGGTINYIARWTDSRTLSIGSIQDDNATVTIGVRTIIGSSNTATGANSFAQGNSVSATGQNAHAQGVFAIASGNNSHAEGYQTTASGDYSHAEGYQTFASGSISHAEGDSTIAIGMGSHAEGKGTIASGSYQLAIGRYNRRGNTTSLFIIGNGTGDADVDRSDVVRVETTGVQISGSLTVSSGSTEFQVLGTGIKMGNAIGDTHTVTGSFNISGSTYLGGNVTGTGSSFEYFISSSSNLSGSSFRISQAPTALNESLTFKLGAYNIETSLESPNTASFHFGSRNAGLSLLGVQPYIQGVPTFIWGAGSTGPNNISRLLMGVNSTTEYTSGLTYPSGSSNYFYINTTFSSPNPATIERRPLYIGAKDIRLFTGGILASESFSRTPEMMISASGEVTINTVLTLPYQNPLPSGKPTGSIATSGSGATFVGLFLYNGTSWVKLSV